MGIYFISLSHFKMRFMIKLWWSITHCFAEEHYNVPVKYVSWFCETDSAYLPRQSTSVWLGWSAPRLQHCGQYIRMILDQHPVLPRSWGCHHAAGWSDLLICPPGYLKKSFLSADVFKISINVPFLSLPLLLAARFLLLTHSYLCTLYKHVQCRAIKQRVIGVQIA